jgi:hypothetical protein
VGVGVGVGVCGCGCFERLHVVVVAGMDERTAYIVACTQHPPFFRLALPCIVNHQIHPCIHPPNHPPPPTHTHTHHTNKKIPRLQMLHQHETVGGLPLARRAATTSAAASERDKGEKGRKERAISGAVDAAPVFAGGDWKEAAKRVRRCVWV